MNSHSDSTPQIDNAEAPPIVQNIHVPASSTPNVASCETATDAVLGAIRDFLGSVGLVIAPSQGAALQVDQRPRHVAPPDALCAFLTTIKTNAVLSAFLELSTRASQPVEHPLNIEKVNGLPMKRKQAAELLDLEERDAKAARLDPELVQIRADKAEMDKRIQNFIETKRAQINASNRKEFLRPKASEEGTCARVDAAQLNRTVQMKLDVVHNLSGPLERSTHRDPAGKRPAKYEDTSSRPLDGIEERIKNVQEHLNVEFVSRTPLDAYQRIKALEDRLQQLEADYPAWAAFFFNQPNRQSHPVLQMPPPLTVVTRTATGDLHASVVPPLPTSSRGRTSRSTAGAKGSTRTVQGAGTRSSSGPLDGNRNAGVGEEDGQGTSGVEKADMESIERRIRALKETLMQRQRQTES
ncbi:uncharacterized protein SPPG_05957 [Spizellomyces punctatus DAOM BR117]|uniref:MAP3K12-binding inhibitory protein 1 n=1 Tax=Spizellomyces punctatus (strain DAOM BR117) TaxID=645134 RepID=A0A0L0HCY6_SPIPD|nr:uncharacterized protein SPPG_05957 [Spizellomyces punctatus DAOM BR117]KNC99007.1 hypothetical protein SPPG_05957 [Spizellomyces punctatus DAOM BR117]|eukprot:XP_016607047.1 hypothetical protein SPPG_05957 [Spizellomyces punctatus DAOM BR117]